LSYFSKSLGKSLLKGAQVRARAELSGETKGRKSNEMVDIALVLEKRYCLSSGFFVIIIFLGPSMLFYGQCVLVF